MSKEEVVEVTDELFEEIKEAFFNHSLMFHVWLTGRFGSERARTEEVALLGQQASNSKRLVERVPAILYGVVPGIVYCRTLLRDDPYLDGLLLREERHGCLFLDKTFYPQDRYLSGLSIREIPERDTDLFPLCSVMISINDGRDYGFSLGISKYRWNHTMKPWLDKYLPPEEED